MRPIALRLDGCDLRVDFVASDNDPDDVLLVLELVGDGGEGFWYLRPEEIPTVLSVFGHALDRYMAQRRRLGVLADAPWLNGSNGP